jgi:hypothetical protein
MGHKSFFHLQHICHLNILGEPISSLFWDFILRSLYFFLAKKRSLYLKKYLLHHYRITNSPFPIELKKSPRPAAPDSAGGVEAVFRRSPAAGAAHGSKVALVLIVGLAPPEPVVLTQIKRPAHLTLLPRLRRRHLRHLGPTLPLPWLRGECELRPNSTSGQIRVGLSGIWLVAPRSYLFVNCKRC